MNEILSKEYARWLNGWQASPSPSASYTEEQIRDAKCKEGYHYMIRRWGNYIGYEWCCKYCGISQRALREYQRKRVSYEY